MVKEAKIDGDYSKHIRIAFLGKTGHGKSSSINNLVGKKILESRSSSRSVTYNCEGITADILNKKCLIVDTPGLYDTERSQNEIFEELKNVMEYTYPGIHVFVIVISLQNRFTEEEQKTVNYLSQYFGKDLTNFGVILFTKLDGLDEDTSLESYIRENDKLNKFVNDFGRRYVGINNRLKIHEYEQVRRQFIDKIDLTIRNNNGVYYSTQLFESSQKAFELELKRIKESEMTIEEKNKQIIQMQKEHQEALEQVQKQNQLMLNQMKMSLDEKNKQIEELNKIHDERMKELQNNTNLALRQMTDSLNGLERTIKGLKKDNKNLQKELNKEKDRNRNEAAVNNNQVGCQGQEKEKEKNVIEKTVDVFSDIIDVASEIFIKK